MKPCRSYRIWFTPRTGSTLLCKALEQTGLAGKPGEYFTLFKGKTLCEEHGVTDYPALRARLWALGTTPNGVFGVKHSLFANRYDRLFGEILALRGLSAEAFDHEEVWSDLFPDCLHIYLTRRNKVRQAVSWWKAIQDQVWHLENGQDQSESAGFYDEKYDFDALSHLFKEAVLQECAMQAYFSRHRIAPLTVVYEDLILDYEPAVRRVLSFLGVGNEATAVAPKFYARTATDRSERWVERFREDLQAPMGEERVW